MAAHHPDTVRADPPGHGALHPFRGVMLMGGAVFLFACLDTTTKYLTADFAVPVVIAVRYLVQCLLMLALLAPTHGLRLVRTQRTGLVVLRAACLSLASLLMGIAYHRLPVAEATAIVFLAPLLVVIVGGRVLRENVGWVGAMATVAGFAGVLLIVRPGGGLDALGIACALCGAVFVASYQLLSRVLAPTETTVAMLFHAALFGSLLYGLLFPWFWDGHLPSLLQAALLLGLGAAAGLGHFLFTAAHRHAPASALAPVAYVQLIWASLLGWWVFGHVSDGPSLLGMGIVAAAGVAVALRSRLTRRAMVEAAVE